MTALKEINEQLKTAVLPVARALHARHGFRVLLMGFNKDMVLKEHRMHAFTRLFMLEGCLKYKEEDKTIVIGKYESLNIPADLMHELYAVENSLCMLIQG